MMKNFKYKYKICAQIKSDYIVSVDLKEVKSNPNNHVLLQKKVKL